MVATLSQRLWRRGLLCRLPSGGKRFVQPILITWKASAGDHDPVLLNLRPLVQRLRLAQRCGPQALQKHADEIQGDVCTTWPVVTEALAAKKFVPMV